MSTEQYNLKEDTEAYKELLKLLMEAQEKSHTMPSLDEETLIDAAVERIKHLLGLLLQLDIEWIKKHYAFKEVVLCEDKGGD